MFLIDDILLAPLKGVLWLGKRINDIVEGEMSDEEFIKERLMELRLKFELDELSEEEYNRQERELMARLDAIRGEREGV